MLNIRYFLAATFMLFLTGCAAPVPLQIQQVSAISRDTSSVDLEKILANATPQSQFEVQANDRSFFVRDYNLQTGTRQDVMVMCTPTCMTIPIAAPVFAEYLVIQNLPSKTIYAWGKIEELSKDSDQNVSSLMPIVKEQLAKLEKK